MHTIIFIIHTYINTHCYILFKTILKKISKIEEILSHHEKSSESISDCSEERSSKEEIVNGVNVMALPEKNPYVFGLL